MANEDNHSFMEHLKLSMAKLLYEFIGTCLFTMIFLSRCGPGKLLIALWVLTVFCWKISGSHFNPAVSIAYIFRRDSGGLPKFVALFYVLAQIGGAYIGGLMMCWLEDTLLPMQPIPECLTDHKMTFRAIVQETMGSFVFVFFFLTQTEQTIMLSKEEAINCLVIAAGYVTARVMVYGEIFSSAWWGVYWSANKIDFVFCKTDLPVNYAMGFISTYGGTFNPAIALSVMFNSPIQNNVTGGEAFKYGWLYPVFPFAGSVLALIFYELVFKKARELCNRPEDSDSGSEGKHNE